MQLIRAALFVAIAMTLSTFCGTTAAIAEYRSDLEIRLGGEFNNYGKQGTWPAGLVVNYITTPKQVGAWSEAGAQVVIYGKEGDPKQMFKVSGERSLPGDVKSQQIIDGATCWRFATESGPVARRTWECLYGDFWISVTGTDGLSKSGKIKIDEVAMLRTLIQRLKGGQPLTAAEVAFRNVLFPALGFAGDTARSCLDEVMNWAEAQTDNTTRDQVAQLKKAATAARIVEMLAATTARPEDFDSQWWDALREVAPNPATPNDPRGTATDLLVDLLPPPLNTLISIGRNTHKGLLVAKNHITDPKVRGEIYACYRRERGGHSPSTGGSAEAYESGLSHILLDATAACPAAETFKSSYENEMRGLSGQERDNAFRRLITPVAIRFEFIYRVEDARANRAARVADAWKPAQNVLEKLKTRVNACIAKPR